MDRIEKIEAKLKDIERSMSERRRQQDAAIDDAMFRAQNIYQAGDESGDPYSMHKAVESLPVAVLVDILKRKTESELLAKGAF